MSAEKTPVERASDLFRCLSSSVRVGIIRELAAKPLCVHQIVDLLGISQPLASQHLRVLRDHRLVEARREGREMTYALVDNHVSAIIQDAMAHVSEEGCGHDAYEDVESEDCDRVAPVTDIAAGKAAS